MINLGIIVTHTITYDLTDSWGLVILPSIASFLMVIQFFYWLSLFQSTSFYVTMLVESFKDIRYFGLMVFLCIFSFANAILLINKLQETVSRQLDEESVDLIEEKFNVKIFDAIMT